MTTPEPHRRNPDANGRTLSQSEPPPGAPSRALRMRAAHGWVKFMRRVEITTRQEGET
ncbi:hypothetical protein [Streptomyces sp. NPDC090025]|uniref:hypothetical protein n=1 Tax=Streptomyces sp. NPDC090025 TaxID=3365922 RepID=UPI003835C576